MDFFAQEFSSENCLVVPPVALMARVIHYLSLQKAMATLVVPLWPSSMECVTIARDAMLLL